MKHDRKASIEAAVGLTDPERGRSSDAIRRQFARGRLDEERAACADVLARATPPSSASTEIPVTPR